MKPFGMLKGAATGLFVLSLPVLFGTLSLRWLVSDTAWYRAGFAKYGVSQRTGIAPEELARSADEISRYLLLQRDSVDISVKIGNDYRAIFNDREIRHMSDVQSLLRGFYNLQIIAAAYAAFYLGASWLWQRASYRLAVGNQLRWGGVLTLGLFGAFGLLSLLDFDEIFLQFHLVSFDNDLWILDPTKDNLIMMFPQGFWYDSAIRLALATAGQALGAVVVGTLLAIKPKGDGRRRSRAR